MAEFSDVDALASTSEGSFSQEIIASIKDPPIKTTGKCALQKK